MKYIKTYEGLFDFFKKKKTETLPPKSDADNCNEITEEIVDSMWDIFDNYNVNDVTTLNKWRESPPDDIQWKYNYTSLNNGEKVKCGIVIINVENNLDIVKDVNEIIPVISARTGIKVYSSLVEGSRLGPGTHGSPSRLIISFFPYISSNVRNRGW